MKMYKTKKLLGLSLIAMSVAGTVQAGEWSAGLNVGQSSLTSTAGELCDFVASGVAADQNVLRSIFSCNADDSDTSVSVNVAYNFTNRWGVELGYVDLGEESSAISFLGISQDIVRAEYSSLYFVGTGTWNLADKWSVTGRLGAAQVEVDVRFPLIDESISVDDTEVMAGLSVNYQFSSNWSTELRYDYFDTEENVDNMSFGIRYSFKK